MNKVFECKIPFLLKGKKIKISFVATDDVYVEDGRLGGYLQVGDKKYPGFFEYTEKSGIGWHLEGDGQKVIVALNDSLMDGRLGKHSDAFGDFRSKIITYIESKHQESW